MNWIFKCCELAVVMVHIFLPKHQNLHATLPTCRHTLSTRQRKNGGGGVIVSMVIPLVENTIVSNEKAEGKATKRTKRSTKGRIRDLGKSGGCLFHISTKCLFLRVRTVTAGIHLINSPRVINFVR